jgi:hypothetical protein
MKIHQLLSGINLPVTNEEHRFIEHHDGGGIKISSLNDHDNWIAQSLVRKGVYTISKDNNTLVKNINEPNT